MRILYASRSVGPHDRRFMDAIVGFGFEVEHLYFGPTLVDGPRFHAWDDLDSVWTKIKSEFDPTLVHAGPLQQVAYPLHTVVDVPMVVMSWGSDILRPPDDPLWAFALKKLLTSSDWMFADCQAVEDAAIAAGFRGETFRFPWGIDLQPFISLPIESRGPFTFLSIRNWEDVYDVKTVCRAFARLVENHPEVRLILGGRGSHEPQIRAILKDIEQVEWLGYVDQAGIRDAFARSDVYVSTSLSDGSSISLLQALASGTPCLVSDIPGNREWVTDTLGWMFPTGDVDALHQLMAEGMAMNSSQLRAMQVNARSVAIERADWTKNAQVIRDAFIHIAEHQNG